MTELPEGSAPQIPGIFLNAASPWLPKSAHGRRIALKDRQTPIRMRLGGGVDLLAPFPQRPKGMHRRTFERLRARADAALFGSNPPAR